MIRRWLRRRRARKVWAAYEQELIEAGEIYVDGTGQKLFFIHNPEDCEGRPCVIHNPSEHHMREWPTHYRFDRRIMERICPHGVGHPDPDDQSFLKSIGREDSALHGCDGCCKPERWGA